jgi:predicted MFS family arabinose efflux permease
VPCVGLLLRDRQVNATDQHEASGVRAVFGNRTFVFLFAASVVGQASNVAIALGRPLIMQTMRFDATTITTVGALGLAIGIVLSLVIGRASDRWGRMPFLFGCFAATPVGLAILAVSQHTWQFWVAGMLQTFLGVGGVVGSALLADTFSESLDTALSFYNATTWIGIVVGLGAVGVGIDALGMTPTLMVSLAVSLLAIALLMPMTTQGRAKAAETI